MTDVPGTPQISKCTYNIRFLGAPNTGFDKISVQVILSTDGGLTSDQIGQICTTGALFEQGLTAFVQKIINDSGGIVTGVSANKRYDGSSTVILA